MTEQQRRFVDGCMKFYTSLYSKSATVDQLCSAMHGMVIEAERVGEFADPYVAMMTVQYERMMPRRIEMDMLIEQARKGNT